MTPSDHACVSPDREPIEIRLWDDDPSGKSARRIATTIWLFMGVAVALRLIRFALNFPLWGDEAFVAVNFINRGYADLLRPLEYNQICPILFLWIELTAVKLFGFSETSMRIFPLACGIASIFVFRHLAGRLLRGLPLLFAVGIFAVSFHPLRHATEAKPYASDLLAALVLLTAVIEWWRVPERNRWLWALVALTPLALLGSHPAVFVAAGIATVLAPSILRTRNWRTIVPFALFLGAICGTFLAQYAMTTATQSRAPLLRGLQAYWSSSFPPLDNPLKFAGWFIGINTGTMFAYPWGDKNGASACTTLAFLAGAAVLWRSRRRLPAAVLLAPFAFTLIAAAMRRYPYGGEARQMQFVAPSICLLAGLGLVAIFQAFPTRFRRGLVRSTTFVLLVTAVVLVRNDIVCPYRFLYDQQARDFARRFWPSVTGDAEVVCLRWDAGIVQRDRLNLRTAVYLCNQAIYSPQRRLGGPRWSNVTNAHPLRSVLYHDTRADNPEVVAWLARMHPQYQLRRTERIEVDTSGVAEGDKTERLLVYEFVPAPAGSEPPANAPSVAQPAPRLVR